MITEICKRNKGKELMMPKVYITVFPGQVGNRKAVSYHHNTYHHNQYIDHIFCSVAKSCPALCDPGTAACQASLSFTISLSLLKFMSTESVMSSNHPIVPFSSCLQSSPVSGSFLVSQHFTSSDQSIAASASA